MPLQQLCILLASFGSSLVILHDKTGQAFGRQFPSKDLVISRIPQSTTIAATLSGTSQLVPLDLRAKLALQSLSAAPLTKGSQQQQQQLHS